MKYILENIVFLILDLEEKIDFDYSDIDEVKNTYYESFLKLLYPSDSDIKNIKMEYCIHIRIKLSIPKKYLY